MSAALPVPHGTAEQLARVHHFRQLTDTLPEAHELDPVIRFLLGRVTDHREVLEQLHDELDQLWSLVSGDFDDDQLDELTDDEHAAAFFPSYGYEVDARYTKTRDRLIAEIEGVIWRAREAAVRCPSCHGAGGWQQPDGLIVECPRGCMTEAGAA